MKNIIPFALLCLFLQKGFAQPQTVSICTEKNGCEYAKIYLSKQQIDAILEKPNFLTSEKEAVILNLTECISSIEKNNTIQKIHETHGGKDVIKERKDFDLSNYLLEKGCKCSNPVKRISFQGSGEEYNGSGYFFMNVQRLESFMPNDSWQQLYQGALGAMVLNTYIVKKELTSYIISEGKKIKSTTPYGTAFQTMSQNEINTKFNKNFNKTGNKKPFLNTNKFQYEYAGTDDEGTEIILWLTPLDDICLSKENPVLNGMYNLSYIIINGYNYLISEASSNRFHIEVTGMENDNYTFDTSGY